MPAYIDIYSRYHDQGFEILGVSLGEEKKAWINAIEKRKLPWPQVSELNGLYNQAKQKYQNQLLGSVLISPAGYILAKDLNPEDLNQVLIKEFEKQESTL
jgi:hypothetical protein